MGTLLITWLITLQPKFSRRSFRGYLLWLAIAVVGGYAIYQGSIVLIAQLMGGHGFSFTILWQIFLKDGGWAVVLSAIHSSLVWLVIQTIPNYSHPSFPPTYYSGYHPPGCGRGIQAKGSWAESHFAPCEPRPPFKGGVSPSRKG